MPTTNLYDSIKNSKEFQEYLKELSEQERENIENSLNTLCEDFQQKILNPLENLLK